MSERAKRASRSANSTTQAALERLKKLRTGEKRAIDFDQEEEDVYDYIDEDEYSEVVRKRTEGEWIVDDDGASGYYEDGREIFDDVDDEDSNGGSKYEREYEKFGSNRDKKVPLKRKQVQDEKRMKKKMGNMKNYLLSNQKNVSKKSFDQMQVEDDDLLKGILDDINTSSNNKPNATSSSQSNTPGHKRKRPIFDEDLIPEDTATSSNNPFLVSSQTNFASIKKARNDSFDEDLDDDLLLDNNDNQDLLTEKKPFKSVVSIADDDFDESFTKSTTEPIVANDNFRFTNDDNLVMDENGDQVLKVYWIDAYEDPRQPGTVYMFGKVFVEKVNKFFSCCLICQNIEHKIYFYKRTFHRSDPNTIVRPDDLDAEVKRVLEQNKIKNFRSRLITKNYAFEKAIESKGEYLEVLFNPTVNTKLSPNLSGDTFSHIFNYSQSSLERLIIDLKFKGPHWLRIKNSTPSSPPISWCKFEYIVKNPFKQITIDIVDQTEVPMSIMSMSLKTYLNPSSKQNEIVSISCMTNDEYLISKNNAQSLNKPNSGEVADFCLLTTPHHRAKADDNCPAIIMPSDFKVKWNKKVRNHTHIDIAFNEKDLIMKFISIIQNKDPDVIIGHDLDSYHLGILKKRLEHHKIMGQHWSKTGRLKRCVGVKAHERDLRNMLVGRLVCDLEIAAKELVRLKSYDLKELALQLINKNQQDFKNSMLPNYFKNETELLKFIELSIEDTRLITSLFIELNVLPLYYEITKIAGNLFSRTLLGGRSERNEYLLLHAFHEFNYILPDKVTKDDKKMLKLDEDIENAEEQAAATVSTNKRNKKAAYTGGLVLDPKVGLYDKYVLLMDFNSLYPSIIQEYKICFTTVDRAQFLQCLHETTGETEKQPEIRKENLDKEGICILPSEIKKLVDERRKVKVLMMQPETSADLKKQLDIKQKALKLTANSMYGCLGFSNSRFYAKPLAALITMKGREILSKTKQLVEESSLKLEVIYGDTDSLMINTKADNYDEAESLGYRLKAEVNKNYNLLEIDIDGIFKRILLLKKKKYAAVIAKKLSNGKLENVREIKGLDVIRRDWSLIATNVGKYVLDQILSDDVSEDIITNIHNYLANVAMQINAKQLPTGSYLINKQLTKDLKDYKDTKGQPHAMVAMRMNENVENERKFKSGDTISYLICTSRANKENFNRLPATQRAFHIDEFKKNEDLQIDAKYYLQSQIHPVVSRLIEPIDGTDANVIAEFLGIESSFATSNQKGTDLDYELLTRTNETRFDTCKSLIFTCPNNECKKQIELRTLVEKDSAEGGKFRINFDRCPHCQESLSDKKYANYFVNHFTVYLRSLLSDYYQTWFTCEDPICKFRTRRFTSLMTKKGPICPECNESILYAEITDAQIYLQFDFFSHMFNISKVINDLPKQEDDNLRTIKLRLAELTHFYLSLSNVVEKFKKQQAYNVVDLTFLFSKQVFTFVNLD